MSLFPAAFFSLSPLSRGETSEARSERVGVRAAEEMVP
jgi:hypothetical protein